MNTIDCGVNGDNRLVIKNLLIYVIIKTIDCWVNGEYRLVYAAGRFHGVQFQEFCISLKSNCKTNDTLQYLHLLWWPWEWLVQWSWVDQTLPPAVTREGGREREREDKKRGRGLLDHTHHLECPEDPEDSQLLDDRHSTGPAPNEWLHC